MEPNELLDLTTYESAVMDEQQLEGEHGSHDAEQGSIRTRSPSLHHPFALGTNSEASWQSPIAVDNKKSPVDDIAWDVLLNAFHTLTETMGTYINLHTSCKNSLERQRQALELVQVQEDYLTDDQMVALLDLLGRDPISAEVYVTMKSESLRKAWVRLKMWKCLGFPKESLDM